MALAAGNLPEFHAHLDICPQCRAELTWLKKYPVAGRIALADPPEGWVEKAVSLAAPPQTVSEKLRKLVGTLVFDSWLLPLPVAARGLPMEHRRLRFEAEHIQFDLRAERRAEGWSFVAQVTSPVGAVKVLRTGRKHLTPDANGVFQWTDRQPPRKVTLHIDDLVLELPQLTWKPPRRP